VRGLADLVWTQQDHDLSTEARFALKLWLERVEAGRYQDAEKDRPNGGRDTAVAR
jgi:hypothetical protein